MATFSTTAIHSRRYRYTTYNYLAAHTLRSPFALSLTMHILSRRPIGWHGESGAAHSGGHLTVDFRSPSNDSEHVVTHHVYLTDDAYW